MKQIIVFLGAPGSGKGTQANVISKKFSLKSLSAGDMLREESQSNTPFGHKINQIIESGKLVPDEIIIELFLNKIKNDKESKGFISDGFPRTLEQAKAFDNFFENNKDVVLKIIYIKVNYETIVSRIINRKTCSNCGEIYNLLTKPPSNEFKCDLCGNELVVRSDDSIETIENRYKTYIENIKSILDYYKNRVINIDGNVSFDLISDAIEEHIK